MARTAGSGRSSLRHLPEELTGLHCAGRLRPDRLRDAVREALGRAEGAKRVAAAFAAAGGPKSAADAFEALDQALRSRAAQGEREVFASRDDQDAPHRLDRQ